MPRVCAQARPPAPAPTPSLPPQLGPLPLLTAAALLTALAAVGRTYLSSGAGYVAKATGWPLFFAICVVVAVPSLILLAWLQRRGHFETLGTVRV